MKKKKPKIGYYRNFDPTLNVQSWVNRLTDINIITTKKLTDNFINVCVNNKNRIYLHIVINGTGKTVLEPNIDTVKKTFENINKLTSKGFPKNQILIIVNPIIQNDNGLNALKLLLKLFTRFSFLRLRYVRFELLKYYSPKNKKENINNYSSIIDINTKNKKWFIANGNITKRLKYNSGAMELISRTPNFYWLYKQLVRTYNNGIITVDDGNEPIIGTRELKPFGYTNRYENVFGVEEKIIKYEKNNKNKPIIDVNLSNTNPVRCINRCLLCPFKN